MDWKPLACSAAIALVVGMDALLKLETWRALTLCVLVPTMLVLTGVLPRELQWAMTAGLLFVIAWPRERRGRS